MTRGSKTFFYPVPVLKKPPRKVKLLFELQEPPGCQVLPHCRPSSTSTGLLSCWEPTQLEVTPLPAGSSPEVLCYSTRLREAQMPVLAFKGRRVTPNRCLGFF